MLLLSAHRILLPFSLTRDTNMRGFPVLTSNSLATIYPSRDYSVYLFSLAGPTDWDKVQTMPMRVANSWQRPSQLVWSPAPQLPKEGNCGTPDVARREARRSLSPGAQGRRAAMGQGLQAPNGGGHRCRRGVCGVSAGTWSMSRPLPDCGWTEHPVRGYNRRISVYPLICIGVQWKEPYVGTSRCRRKRTWRCARSWGRGG